MQLINMFKNPFGMFSRSSTPKEEPKPKTGVVGQGVYAHNVRLLFVNGVGYEEWETRKAAEKISKIFGDVQVEYTHIPMGMIDVFKALRWKARHPGCALLLQHIRSCIESAKVPSTNGTGGAEGEKVLSDGEARLILFAHSGGSVMFRRIADELTPEERKSIDVFTFGGVRPLKRTKFHDAINAVAYWDPFPAIGRMVSGKREKKIEDSSEKTYWAAGSLSQLPVLCHKFLRTPYQNTLQKIKELYDATCAVMEQAPSY